MIPDVNNKPNGYNVDRVISVLSEIIGMCLTNEGSGESLDFLEITLSLRDGAPGISLKRPVMQYSVGMSSPPSPMKLLDPFSPNARRMLRSLVPNLVKKAAHYRLPVSGNHFAKNISTIANTLRAKGYPSSCRRPHLLRKASDLDLCGPAMAGLSMLT